MRPTALFLHVLCGVFIVLTGIAHAQDAPPGAGAGVDFAEASPSASTDESPDRNTDGKTVLTADSLEISPGKRQTIEIYDDETRRVRFSADVKSVRIGNPFICDFEASDESFQLRGKSEGKTRIDVTLERTGPITFDVVVTRNVSEISSLLKRLYPEASIEVIPARDSLILRGTVTEAEHQQQIVEIAQQFAPTILDQLKVRGTLSAGTIPDGYRVVSVPIRESQTIAGFLRAGDRVDVQVTFQSRDPRGVMRTITATLLEDVEVFAPDARPDDRSTIKVVALLLQTEYVSAIRLAESRGELSLSWRSPQAETATKLNAAVLRQFSPVEATESGSDPLSSPPPQTGPEPQTPPRTDLQQIRDELRGLHDDVRRLIEILEQRKHNESRESPQGAAVPPMLTEPKGKLTALFFSADWCGPCQKMTPIVNRLTTQHGCTIRTINIDADREMAGVFAIRSLPTFVILDDGRVIDRIVGLTSEERLKQALSRNLDTDTEVGESSASDLAWEVLGLRLSPAKDDGFADGGPYRGGLEVAAVRPDSPAASQTIRVGDILVGLHVWETKSLENVNYVLHHRDFSKFLPLRFYIVRDHETRFGHMNIEHVPYRPDCEIPLSSEQQTLNEPAKVDPGQVKSVRPTWDDL